MFLAPADLAAGRRVRGLPRFPSRARAAPLEPFSLDPLLYHLVSPRESHNSCDNPYNASPHLRSQIQALCVGEAGECGNRPPTRRIPGSWPRALVELVAALPPTQLPVTCSSPPPSPAPWMTLARHPTCCTKEEEEKERIYEEEV